MMVIMEESDKQHVGQAIRRLCAVHKIKYGTDVFEGYWDGLRSMSRGDFDRALLDLQEHSEWMPRPAHFRASLRKGWL